MSNGGGEESCRTVGDVMVLSILPALGCLRAGQARIGFQKRERTGVVLSCEVGTGS